MLVLITGSSEPTRVQCAFVDTPEVEDIVNYVGAQVAYPTAYLLPEYIGEGGESSSAGTVDLSDRDPLFDEAARLIVIQQQGSTSLIQRKFAIGYNRAGRLMDQLEAAGIVGPFEGSKARSGLDSGRIQPGAVVEFVEMIYELWGWAVGLSILTCFECYKPFLRSANDWEFKS